MITDLELIVFQKSNAVPLHQCHVAIGTKMEIHVFMMKYPDYVSRATLPVLDTRGMN